ncbi:T9SS type A sorting domain-containing protein [Flavobacterium sp.]|uniref:T9SS type A sorting domain-containing protein n=1 Tax=Flavobacterium sp. TaxID=239 RepID=UPI00374D9A0B
MRKKYIYLVLLLVFNTVMFAQKVILTPTAVNGASVSSSGPINLGGTPNSSVSLGVRVEMPVIPGNTGTISIYSIYGLNANVVIGGNGGILIFNEGKIASRSFVVNLNWSDFQTSGGYIYAEYKTASNVSYKSGYIAVVKNATMGGGTINPPADAPNPSKITNTLCCNQTVRLGEKPAPILGSQYLNPYENYIYGVNSRWTIDNGNIVGVDNASKTLYLDYTTQLKNLTIKRFLGYNGASDLPNGSNTITITVVPSPITSNEIRVTGSTNSDGSIEIATTNPKDILGDQASINLNILQNPLNTPTRRDPSVIIEKYEWEYSITNGTAAEERAWNTISNQSSISLNSMYLPRFNSNKDNSYIVRRIALYQNLKIASNTLKISMRAIRDNNTICCDQNLEISSTNLIQKPSIITGTTTISDKNTYLFYQWQSQIISERGLKVSNWTNIPEATSKDYTPPTPEFIPGTGRNQPTVPIYNYRRIATDNGYLGETYYSNEISLTSSTSGYSKSSLIIYPNPATSILNIENTDTSLYGGKNFKNALVSIVNIMGNVVNSNDFSLLNSNLINVNISNLPAGLYFINISGDITSQLSYAEQFTFVKQ